MILRCINETFYVCVRSEPTQIVQDELSISAPLKGLNAMIVYLFQKHKRMKHSKDQLFKTKSKVYCTRTAPPHTRCVCLHINRLYFQKIAPTTG